MMYLQSVTANGFCSVRIRGPLDEAKLRRSLERLPRRHPLLGARVILEQDVHTFTTEAVSPLPLRATSDDGSGQSFLKVIAEEIVTPLNRTTGPLVRFTLVRHPDGERTDLIMTVDHTIADGSACLYAIRDLLAFDEAPEFEREPVPLPPPISHLLPASIIDARPSSEPSQDERSQSTTTFSASTTDIVIGSAALEREPMLVLARRCRERGVTVYAAVCVAFGEAFAALFENKTKVTISSPVSCRPRLAPSVREAFSCSIAFTRVHVALSPPSSFWEQAHAVRQQLLEGTTDQKLFGPLSVIEEANKAERDDSRFLHRARQRRHHMDGHDISITNLGRQAIPSRYGELTIDAIHGGAGLPGEIVIALFTADDTMHVTLLTRGLSGAANDAARRMVASALSRLRMLPP
jgi:hypothetical protein